MTRRRTAGEPTAAPPAHQFRIPTTAELQLSEGLNWLRATSKRRLSAEIVNSAMDHYRERGTEPAILLAAAVAFLVAGADKQPGQLNRYWHIADQVSARERARYLNTDEKELI